MPRHHIITRRVDYNGFKLFWIENRCISKTRLMYTMSKWLLFWTILSGSIGILYRRMILTRTLRFIKFEKIKTFSGFSILTKISGGWKLLNNILEKYKNVFLYNFVGSFSLNRDIDHAIKVDSEVRSPHPPFHQLSPTKFLDVRKEIINLIQKKNILCSKMPYEAFLLFIQYENSAAGCWWSSHA